MFTEVISMVLNVLREVKERGIRNMISEEIEKIKELGVAGYLKTKAEEMKETAVSTVMGAQRKLIGEVKPTYTQTTSKEAFVTPENLEISKQVTGESYSRERSGM